MNKFLKFGLVSLSILVLVVGCGVDYEGQSTDDDLVEVVKVVDGDTIHVEMPDGELEKIRMIGVDTPETVHPNKPVECFGKEASAFTKTNLLGEYVWLEPDYTQSDRDRYDRLLRYVWINGENFNEWLIQGGYAYEYTYGNNVYKYQADFKEAQQYAEEEEVGLWGEGVCT